MKQKISEVLNLVVNSKWLVVIIGIILFLKTIFFYKNTIDMTKQIEPITITGTISFLFVLTAFMSVLPNRIRIKVAILVDILISILLYADNLYYTFSNSVISVAQISNLQYTEQITATLPMLIKLRHILYFIDIIMVAFLFMMKFVKTKVEKKKFDKKEKIKTAVIILVAVVVFCAFDVDYIKRGVEKSYNKDLQLAESTIYGYHISDVINTINLKKNTKYKHYDEMIVEYDKLKQEYEEQYGEVQYDLKGILENQNIIILQLESLQEFLVDAKINGKEITPNLNQFLKENIEFTNMHMQSYSTTADSEHTTVTSTYPMENGMSFSRYYTNDYDDIYQIFTSKNYDTSYMHGNYSWFWNRGNVYGRMPVNHLIFKDSYEDLSENINGDLSDELFYKQSVSKLKEQEAPFFAYLVSASSHTPFDLNGIIDRENKVTIDVGEYKNTYFGNYLEAANYADYAFGIFLDCLKEEGLYEDTTILLFGDHNGLTMYEGELIEFLKQENPNLHDIDLKLNYTRVLCGMRIPQIKEHIIIEKPINKLDIKPTMAYLCNIEDGFSLGTNMLASKDFVCLNNGRIIAQDYYFDEQWYETKSGEKVEIEHLSSEEKEKLEQYYDYMTRELEISLSVNINNLLNK